MKILIYGAGVLGSLYAVRLAQAGYDVTILARSQRLADLRARGIVLVDSHTGQQTTTRVNVVEQLAPEDAYDLIIVLMRRNQVDAILPALASNRHTPSILFMTNNAAGAATYVAALGTERVLLGFPGAGGVRAGRCNAPTQRRAGRLSGSPTTISAWRSTSAAVCTSTR
ncbi:MAG TPA: 2-dehydropantoate 2-reductase N-terminal domain-containing protein [Roseiflexaceae bacterium]|nr:2-dehydropantoate 2-reductase N-terminal domain-containing protein [Roseiflexaceae bacterium]